MNSPASKMTGSGSGHALVPAPAGGVVRLLARVPIHIVIIVLCAVWFTPNFALLISSFRPASEIATTGWWTAFTPPLKFTLDLYRQALATSNMGEASSIACISPSRLP